MRELVKGAYGRVNTQMALNPTIILNHQSGFRVEMARAANSLVFGPSARGVETVR